MLSRYITVLLGAAGLFLGFADNIAAFPFLVLLYPYSLYMLGHSGKNGVRDSLLTGILGYGAAFYWLAVTANMYGAMPYWLAVFCPLLLGLYFSLYGAFLVWYLRKILFAPALPKIFSLALLWYLLEIVRGFFGTGFPWFPLSSAFVPVPKMIQFADTVGAYGLSGILALSAFLFAELMRGGGQAGNRAEKYVLRFGGIAVLFFLYGYGAAVLKNAPQNKYELSSRLLHEELDIPYTAAHEIPAIKGRSKHSLLKSSDKDAVYVTLVQGNISQNVKWSKLFQEDSIKKFFRLTEEAQDFLALPSVFVYPETALPLTSYHNADLYKTVREFSEGKTLIYGIPYFENEKYYNSIEIMQNGVPVMRYAKEHLVPFGEYVPEFPLPDYFRKMIENYGGAYSPGENGKKILSFSVAGKTVNLLPLICYEAIFPEMVWQRLEEGNVHALLNVSNDAWYDKTSAPFQHLNLAVMRCAESGLPMLRASNTGISAFADRYGRVQAQTGLFTDETLTVPLSLKEYSPTFFVRAARYLPFAVLFVFLFLQIALLKLRRIAAFRQALDGMGK